MLFAQDIQRIDPIICRHALIAQRSKLIGQQATVDRMIVNHQNHHVIIAGVLRIRGS
ncbi:Uncharacterised protein [Klebsiella pneumoniae]|nr:Uncharacterised protein [Klebsiella pneumoniae]